VKDSVKVIKQKLESACYSLILLTKRIGTFLGPLVFHFSTYQISYTIALVVSYRIRKLRMVVIDMNQPIWT
jgi:hypothetical protein